MVVGEDESVASDEETAASATSASTRRRDGDDRWQNSLRDAGNRVRGALDGASNRDQIRIGGDQFPIRKEGSTDSTKESGDERDDGGEGGADPPSLSLSRHDEPLVIIALASTPPGHMFVRHSISPYFYS